MVLLRRKEPIAQAVDKVMEIDASMQGTVVFKDPVNLRVNGRFEGKLQCRGSLTIGEHAIVAADIIGDQIIVAGRVQGEIEAHESLSLVAPAVLIGNIRTPSLSIAPGSVFQGVCQMLTEETVLPERPAPPVTASGAAAMASLSLDDVSRYLEVDRETILQWAAEGRIPAERDGSVWRFDRAKIDTWLVSEKAQ